MEQLHTWYTDLHREPEPSRKEYRTAEKLTLWLQQLGLEVHRLGETAVIGVLRGANPGKTVALRADMDALPVTEQTGLDYASEIPGMMHACGHDFHMTAVLGAAKILKAKQKALAGTVQFVFQPDEEEDGYAAILSADEIMKNTDAVFGAHVDPTLPAGTYGFKSGIFYASAATFDIVFHGKSAHGAKPQEGIDALAAAAEAVPKLLALRREGDTPAVLSVGSFHSGTVRNVIADTATLSGILRSADPATRAAIHLEMKAILSDLETRYGVTVELKFAEGYRGITNPTEATALARAVAVETAGADKVSDIPEPLMTTEDFGEYLNGRDGCFYHIGVGGAYGLHSNHFAPDPELLVGAATLHAAIIEKYLEEK
ncbi:MAG: amidohydrolase [Clostridia bacterium]|nr:amidohydrolase [Clostridia bacterium]